MTLYSIRLELARTAGYPEGSAQHGYEFVAPLDAAGHLDAEQWRVHKHSCVVRRFNKGEDDESGVLVHHGKGWRFDYDKRDHADDEPLFKLDRHLIKKGEYLSITEHDGVSRPFRVVRVTAAG